MIQFSLASWYNSITLLYWANLRLFILVSLKSVSRALPFLISHFWWAFLVHALIQIFSPSTFFFIVVKTLATWIMIYLYCLALRPSLEIKNQSYFHSYAPYIFYFFLIGGILLSCYLLCMGVLFMCNVASLGAVLGMNEFVKMLVAFPVTWEITYPISSHILFPLRLVFSTLSFIVLFTTTLLSGLFELDNLKFSSIPASIRAGITMLGYNFPIMMILGGLFTFTTGSTLFFSQWYDSHSYLLSFTVWIGKEIAVIFIVSLLINFYLKIKHSNYSLFFASSKQ